MFKSWSRSRFQRVGGALCFGLVLAALMVSCSRPERPPGAFTVGPSTETVPDPNPVRDEMQLLAVAIGEVVAGIVDGDLSGVEAELHAVHVARESTEHAISEGHYRLPAAGPDATLEHFVALDQAFHQDLEALLAASRADDVGATIDALGVVLEGCHGCHRVFRPSVTRTGAPVAAAEVSSQDHQH